MAGGHLSMSKADFCTSSTDDSLFCYGVDLNDRHFSYKTILKLIIIVPLEIMNTSFEMKYILHVF